jgi:hypothetical protein
MYGLRSQPSAVMFAVRSVFNACVAYGLVGGDVIQLAALTIALDAVTSVLLGANITTQSTLQKAGTSQDTVTALANTRTGPPSFTSRL